MLSSTNLLIGAGRGFNGLRNEARDLLSHDNLSNDPEPSTRQLAQDLAMVNGRTLEFQESICMWLTELMVILLTGIQDFPLEPTERKSALELIGIKGDNKFNKQQTRGDCSEGSSKPEHEASDEYFSKEGKLPYAIWKRIHGGLENGNSTTSNN